MKREFRRGHEMIKPIAMTQTLSPEQIYNDLKMVFDDPNFFLQHRIYLGITAYSESQRLQDQLNGLIDSRIRHLVGALGEIPGMTVVPWPYMINRGRVSAATRQLAQVEDSLVDDSSQDVMASAAPETDPATSSSAAADEFEPLTAPVAPFDRRFADHFFIGLTIDRQQASERAEHTTTGGQQLNLGNEVAQWQAKHVDPKMRQGQAIAVQPIKSRSLPDWVFKDGVRPASKAKKSSATTTASGSVDNPTLPPPPEVLPPAPIVKQELKSESVDEQQPIKSEPSQEPDQPAVKRAKLEP